MNKMVAVVAPYFKPKIGGVERYSEQVARAINESPGLRAVVFTTGAACGRMTTEDDLGLTIVRIPSWVRISNTPFSPLWPLQLNRLFRQYKVDIVTTHAPVPLFADAAVIAARHRPIIETYHAGSMAKNRQMVDRLLRAYERHVLPLVFKRAAALVAVSPTSLAYGAPRARLISPGVDTSRFVPPPPGSRQQNTLLYVGRMDRTSRWKGVDVLINSFAQVRDEIPEATLRLAGDGDDVDTLKALVTKLGLTSSVEFCGVLSGAPLVGAYQTATALVLPSLTESESFGMTLIEAMACATPVIGSAVGGVPYVIDDGSSGILVPPKDPSELARQCVRLLGDESECARLGNNGLATTTSRFSTSTQLRKQVELIQEILETH